MSEAWDGSAVLDGDKDVHGRRLRTATVDDIPRLCAISCSATKKFSSILELADLADDQEEPLTIQQWLALGNIYLVEAKDLPVGFIAAHPLDNTIYIAEIAVHEDNQSKGLGEMLLKAVCRWAVERATFEGSTKARVSLTTYPDVPWNGPWYQKFGFLETDASEVGPWHLERMTKDENEKRLVRPGYRRCCMLWETSTGKPN
jgi:GNAT superfamily N-acetyltransferase